MKQEHGKKDVRTNSIGATHDIDKELSGNNNSGMYFDSENGRVSSKKDRGSWKKIKGNSLISSNTGVGDFFCMVSISVNSDLFEIWVEKTNLAPPKIIINGTLMGESVDMPWLYDHRIQWDKNDNCIGGEVYLTDYNVAPMIFSISDIKENFANSTQKYFSEFNPNLYYINLSSPLDIPVFKELVNLGSGGGLPVGSYEYSLRYSNDEGDKTNWGVSTPPIPVLQSVDNSSTSIQYHGIKSFGSEPSLSLPSPFGVKLKFRVTNLNNYNYIEIRRVSYNTSAGVDVVPNGEIIARIEISDGEISIREFIDPVESNIELTLADNEDSFELSAIKKAKGIRYHDKKLVLMNFDVESKETNADINEIGTTGQKILPIMKNLGTLGFNNPVAHAYNKNYPSGEKFSFGIEMFDGGGGAGFVYEDDDLKNILVPNRREVMTTESKDLSIGVMPVAATVDSSVDTVFEIFSHDNAIGKNGSGFRNISTNGSKDGNSASDIGYSPLRPVNSSDSKIDHSYQINKFVRDSLNSPIDYDPKCFALDYYSKGFAIGAVQSLPNWVKSFSVVRSDRARRVVCQGVGMYRFQKIEFGPDEDEFAGKTVDRLWFHSPDIDSGIVNASVLDDIISNPTNYQIQFVSPLGFFSEVYNFNNITLQPDRDRIIDMISYARVINDQGQINPNEDANMGIGSSGKRYVAYNKYRNTSNSAGQGAFAGDNGNKVFTINSFSSVTEGRGRYFELGLSEDIYNLVFPGFEADFNDQQAKDFTEPIYMINIIQVGKDVQDLNINKYKRTGHYQKLTSIIGEGNGGLNQSFELVDERWEDCIPSLLSTDFNSNGESFIFLIDAVENERIFLNVTHFSAIDVSNIINDITVNGFYLSANGFEVVGIYEHQIINEVVVVTFPYPDYIPLDGENVVVKYDDTRPIVFFGGDTVVNENIFSPIDRESDWSVGDLDNQLAFKIPFPYRRYDLNSEYFIVEDTFLNNIQSSDRCRLGYIRQLCLMYAAESVTATNFAFNSDFPLGYFPLIHYVMRPGKFDDSNFSGGNITDIASDNDLYEQYFIDFPREWELWKYGGFRFLPSTNTDYSVKGAITSVSKPDIGFEEQNSFCTGVTWSLSRAINQQDSPGLKTFLSLNRYFADDDSGGIMKSWDATTRDKGGNLYGICRSGIVLFLTKKSILSNISGDDLSTLGTDKFISGEYWVSRDVGSNDEMWRGMADASIDVSSEVGKYKNKALFIPNDDGVFVLLENTVFDITEDKYLTRILPSLQSIDSEYKTHVVGHYDENHDEYWLQIPDVNDMDKQKCFVYCNETKNWVGRFTYSHDSYVRRSGLNIGLKNLSRYELEKGFQIDNQPIESYLIQHTSVELIEEKEFISIEVNTGARGSMKPTEIVFMDEDMNELCRLNESLYGVKYLKQYNGWWNQIPRKEISASPTRDRVQYRLLLYKIIHTFEEDFKVVTSVVEYKNLK